MESSHPHIPVDGLEVVQEGAAEGVAEKLGGQGGGQLASAAAEEECGSALPTPHPQPERGEEARLL